MFLCIVCQNLPIPKFALGPWGVINKNSVKLSMCSSCDGLACFNCWSILLQKENPACPKCDQKIDLPSDFDPIKAKEDKTLENYMSLCSQKILLNILYKEPVTHKCRVKQTNAKGKARTKMFDEEFR